MPSQRRRVKDFVPAPGLDPWDRQPGEGDKAWDSFVVYRDMADRTLAKAAKVRGLKAQSVEEFSQRWGWRSRVEGWDRQRDRMERDARTQAQADAIRSMVERHTAVATTLQRLASVELGRLVRQCGADAQEPDMGRAPTLSMEQIRLMMDYAVKLERLNRGEPGEIDEHRTGAGGTPWAEIVRLAKDASS